VNILHTVEFYSPSVGGAQEVVRQISELLVKRGHDVTVATMSLAQPYLKRLPAGCSLYSPYCELIARRTSELPG